MDSHGEHANLKILDFGFLTSSVHMNRRWIRSGRSHISFLRTLMRTYGKEVDLWSHGIITYLLLYLVLLFDVEDYKEIARQSIHDQECGTRFG